ncbi:hypothetical protein [Aneurinibacillus migulanus]|jgi:hypothetical protein|uniref:Uncharacterized protein n=1 Tax=Aneurinibacillus migulanus TaxID=47500 RepID=A0A1G8K2R2_ANEMI|nr:hypothetical protein [Aneurinibacillus migulanus]MED0891865.1 hypothetical protein [Aneurinibacillus migulanus]MED1617395.1 hypothetical protein [Aneurinibacillus migulanus]MED4726795.1 hypothetical protein [Aneurinibacillus migulanus]SDI37708.1 hypothetical protein SAMN04487909_103261 [Aneurinibacillus migulanus]
MTLRALELQIAIPRMQDMGKIQEQLQQRPQQEQAGLALEQQEKDEVNRTRIAKAEESPQSQINQDEKEQSGEQGADPKKRRQKKSPLAESETHNLHPYKGHSLDISL